MSRRSVVFAFLASCIVITACDDEEHRMSWREAGEEFGGGDATVFDLSVNAFGNPAPNLTGDKDLLFVTGNSFFKMNWVTAPASAEDLDGLGPIFNARSCSSCHALDGRGRPPLSADEKPVGLLFRMSTPGIEWSPEPTYGDQLQLESILGVASEGNVTVTYDEQAGSYPDGQQYSLRKPNYVFNLAAGNFASGTVFSPRVAPQMIGMGLLEAIDPSTLIDLSDPEDVNGDGISGRVNYVRDVINQKESVGRFGWKANQPSVRQQVSAAFNGDIGITSSLFPLQPCTSSENDCNDATSGGDPELTKDILDRVTLYSATLAVPKRRDWNDEQVLQGKKLFNHAKCASCHLPKLVTGTSGDFPEFMNQTIRPYTDLLLHDMGDELADGRPDGHATGSEWRTPPLWGLGLLHVVSGHTFLLHDGRARTIEEAILWHSGEAAKSREAFMNLEEGDRKAIIKFIESL
jgi:CxxC motif-containing protein (DUF1111 family)